MPYSVKAILIPLWNLWEYPSKTFEITWKTFGFKWETDSIEYETHVKSIQMPM